MARVWNAIDLGWLLLTVAGLWGPFLAADAAPLEMVSRAQFEAWFKEISNLGGAAQG